jgi:hypothetical protein
MTKLLEAVGLQFYITWVAETVAVTTLETIAYNQFRVEDISNWSPVFIKVAGDYRKN